jgi:hypothetical protein
MPGRWIRVITLARVTPGLIVWTVDGFSLSGLLSGVVTLSWVIPSLAAAARLP